jgi:hypothetical protein
MRGKEVTLSEDAHVDLQLELLARSEVDTFSMQCRLSNCSDSISELLEAA